MTDDHRRATYLGMFLSMPFIIEFAISKIVDSSVKRQNIRKRKRVHHGFTSSVSVIAPALIYQCGY